LNKEKMNLRDKYISALIIIEFQFILN
jgi:hypothetical protein